jgi:hypothetical protein
MSRAAVNLALSTNLDLLVLGLQPEQTYAANAIDTPIEKPFIVMRWEEVTPAFKDKGTQGLTVWVHDELGDYTRIDLMLEKVKEILTAMVHVAGSDGRVITLIEWTGDSPDFWDDGFNTITRNSGFRVVSRAL